jgi:ankyrin repeat protein
MHSKNLAIISEIVTAGNVNKLSLFINSDPNIFNSVDSKRYNLFQYVSEHGSAKIVQALIEVMDEQQLTAAARALKPLNWRPIWLNHVLFDAAKEGHVAMLTQCLDLGADSCARDAEDNTPLHFALGFGRREAAEILLKRDADEHLRNKAGLTAIDVVHKVAKNPQLADWFIQRSRQIRLQELRQAQRDIIDLRKKVDAVFFKTPRNTEVVSDDSFFSLRSKL